MRRVWSFYLVLSVFGVVSLFGDPGLSRSAWAGPNENGVLFLHAVEYFGLPPECTLDLPDYCDCNRLEKCEDANVDADNYGSTHIIWAIMGFPEGSSPQVGAVRFGIDYDNGSVFFNGLGPCDATEFAGTGWPSPGTGTRLVFDTPRIGEFETVYWIGGYEYYGTTTLLSLTPHPELGGAFEDDSNPPVDDEILDYGAIGFNSPGYLPCPDEPVPVEETSWGRVKSEHR